MGTPTRKQLEKRVMCPHALALGLMVKLLMEGTTTKEISELTGIHRQTIYRYICALRKQHAVYIAAWEKDTRGRDCLPFYKIGVQSDNPRNKISDAERQRRYRRKKQQIAVMHAIAGTKINQTERSATCLISEMQTP